MIDASLVTDNIGLVHKYARPFRHRPDYDDIISAGIVGLARAASSYNADIAAFTTHAMVHVKQQILTYVNRLSPVVRGTGNTRASDAPFVLSLDMPVRPYSHVMSVEEVEDKSNAFADVCRDAAQAVRQIVEAATDIPPAQRNALLNLLDGKKLSHLQQTHLVHFRRKNCKSAPKIKEILHDNLTA
jgi:DNA-directed RNA polymerase specialized sigma24 family protein